jgi:hypothetical protein
VNGELRWPRARRLAAPRPTTWGAGLSPGCRSVVDKLEAATDAHSERGREVSLALKLDRGAHACAAAVPALHGQPVPARDHQLVRRGCITVSRSVIAMSKRCSPNAARVSYEAIRLWCRGIRLLLARSVSKKPSRQLSLQAMLRILAEYERRDRDGKARFSDAGACTCH